MVMLVVVINTLISLILLYVAWRVWKLKHLLAFVANRLNAYERATHGALKNAPENIYISQQAISNLREANLGVEMQIQQVRQIINLLLLGQQTWRRYFRRLGSTWGKKIVAK